MNGPETLPIDPILAGFPTHSGFKVVPPCILIDKLGEGAMGVVWRARHYNLEVDVAVKFLRPDASSMSQEFVDRFQREARIAAGIKQENLVGVFDTLERDGVCYTVMELVDGETVESRVARKGILSYPEAATILMLAMKGLAALHERRIIHRDVKPSNIIVSRSGHVKLADLGIARDDERLDTLQTRANAIIGTPQYMSPEQFDSAAGVSDRSDVYAMGVTLLFMLTARHVIAGDSLPEIMRRVCMDGVPSLTKFRPDAPPEVVQLATEMTAPKAAARPDAKAVINRLGRLLHGWVQEPVDLSDPNASPTFASDVLPSKLDRTLVKEIRRAVTTNTAGPRPEQLRQAATAAYAQTQAAGSAATQLEANVPPPAFAGYSNSQAGHPPTGHPPTGYPQPAFAPGGQPMSAPPVVGHSPQPQQQWVPGTAPAPYAPSGGHPAQYPRPKRGRPLLKVAAVLLFLGVCGAGAAVYFVPELRAKAMALVDGNKPVDPQPATAPATQSTTAPTQPATKSGPTVGPTDLGPRKNFADTRPSDARPTDPKPDTKPTDPPPVKPPPVKPPNVTPSITVVMADPTVTAGKTVSVPFSVADDRTDADLLIVTAESSDPVAVAVAMDPAKTGPSRAVKVTPSAVAAAGTVATVTLRVRDADNAEASRQFKVTVAAVPNTAPTIAFALPAASIPFGQANAGIGVTIDDGSADPKLVTLKRATSSDQQLVPDAGITLQGSGRDRQLVIAPARGQAGTATVTVTVADAEGLTAQATVNVTVWGSLAEARKAAAARPNPDWPRAFERLSDALKEATANRAEPEFVAAAKPLLQQFRAAFPERPSQRKSWDDRRTAVPGYRALVDRFADEGKSSVAALLAVEDRVRYRRFPEFNLQLLEKNAPGYAAQVQEYVDALRFADLAVHKLGDPQYEACAYVYDVRVRHPDPKVNNPDTGRAWMNIGVTNGDVGSLLRYGQLNMFVALKDGAAVTDAQKDALADAKRLLEQAANGNDRQKDDPVCGLAAYMLAQVLERDANPKTKATAAGWYQKAKTMGYAREQQVRSPGAGAATDTVEVVPRQK